jgi:hypothetical protein
MYKEPLLSISEERSIFIHGLCERKSASVNFLDDDVIIHVAGKPDVTISYHQIKTYTTGETFWILRYLDSSHGLHIFQFMPHSPTTPKYCTRILRSFTIDILIRNKNLFCEESDIYFR